MDASLCTRSNKKGQKVYFIKYRLNGKQKEKTIGPVTKTVAINYLTKFRSELAELEIGLKKLNNITLKNFQKKYFNFARAEKSKRTIEREIQIVNHFASYFGNPVLNKITVEHILEYRNYRLEKVSAETINLEFRHLKAIFNVALRLKHIIENPFREIKPIRTPENKNPQFLDLDDIQKVREAFKGDEFASLVEFYLLTGTRLGEPLSLTWANVNWKAKQITIESRFTKAKKHRIIEFSEDKELEDLLKRLPKRKDNLLFGPPNNKPQWQEGWVSHRISRILTKIGFPWATCHTFRHTYISHLVMAGVPLTTVQAIVGHGSYKTTEKYNHLALQHKVRMQSKRPY
jgi:integrase